jgi:hypothetical protein
MLTQKTDFPDSIAFNHTNIVSLVLYLVMYVHNLKTTRGIEFY